MLDDLFFQTQQNLPLIIQILNAIVNLTFSGAIAKDSGRRYKSGQPIFLVNGITWAFATLIGGVFVACAYWLLHNLKKTVL